jgi:predicted phage terminase large subunit-like protein
MRTFFQVRTSRKFELSNPLGRESHYITIARALERVIKGECSRLIINVPPRYGKTEAVIHFIAWAMARYPDSNFLYVSYSHSLAKKQTQTIRDIITMPEYASVFDVHLKEDSTAKDNFATSTGGSVYAAGAQGTITGFGAGIKGCDRFGGCIVIDDIHKPDEVTSDTIRDGIIDWYYNTLQSRINNPATPIIFIGQRLHEHDLAAVLLESGDWEKVIIPAVDEAGNALHPQMHDLPMLKKMQEESPYHFAAQYMQDPQPAGGGIFKEDWFMKLDMEPHIKRTFITVDTAETDKNYNDATVFSFWGLYNIEQNGVETDIYGLHWLNCIELRIEPKDLHDAFMSFYRKCMQFYEKPRLAAIEKKSTGVTLSSTLSTMQGLQIIDVSRTKASGTKTSRYLEIQPIIATKRVTLPEYGEHTLKCIDHCRKITANNTHRHDDIADTLYDAVKLALIDEVIIKRVTTAQDYKETATFIMSGSKQLDRLRAAAHRK